MMAKYTKTSIIDYAECFSLKLKEIIEINKKFQIKKDVFNEIFKSYFNAYWQISKKTVFRKVLFMW